MKREFLVLFPLSLIFNLSLSFFIRAPNYLDDAYYYGGALRLAQGQGFTEPYLWTYLDSPTSLPRPSHLYWMPLTSIIAALPMIVFGQNFFIARLPFIIITSLMPLITYHVVLQTSEVFKTSEVSLRRHALTASLITLFSGFYPIFFATTDSFALYAVIVSLTFIALHRGVESNQKRGWFIAGLGVGFAHITRADGMLLLIIILIIALFPNQRIAPSPLHPFTFSLFGYFLIATPWFIRNFTIAGSPLGSSGMATLWLVEYNDLFNYPPNVTLARYLNAGIATILRGKFDVLFINAQTILAVQCLIFLAPFVLIGLWQLRNHTLYRVVMLYAGLLYTVMTFVFSFVGARGGLFHSGAALLPFYIPASLVGLNAAIDWIARRRSTWNADQAKKIFSVAMVGLAAMLTLVITINRLRDWNSVYDHYRQLQTLTPADAVVISNNPPLIWVAANRGGAMIPNGDEAVLLRVAEQFNARYVLMDENHVPQLDRLYKEGKGDRLKLVSGWSEYKLFEITR